MFPSFKSLRDRKNKLKQLAEENSEELQLARIKNDRYKLTQWATDLDQTIDNSKLQQLLRKVAPTMTSAGVQAAPSMTTMGMQAAPTMTTIGTQVTPSMTTMGMQAVPEMTTMDSQYDLEDIGDEEDSLSDIDDSRSTYEFGTQVESTDFNFQKNA